jgi:hypothetical protein
MTVASYEPACERCGRTDPEPMWCEGMEGGGDPEGMLVCHRCMDELVSQNGLTGSAVPPELERWFEGFPILGEQYGLPRIETRVRVIEVLADLGDDPKNPWIAKGEIREFKTDAGAQKLARQWESEGKVVLVQYAVVWWLTADELPQSRKD